MKNNQRGSALLWSLIVIMVLLIFVGAGLGVSFSYFNRSLQYEVRQQVYYTAHSGIEAVAASLRNDTNENVQKLTPKNVGDKVNISNITFSSSSNGITTNNDELGTVSATIEKIEEKVLKITVTASKGGQTYVLYGDVAYTKDAYNKYHWNLYQTYDDENNLIPVPEK